MSRWTTARLVSRTKESDTARTLHLDAPGWPGHLAGQHVDLRLTADDGYQAVRSYSLSAPADGDRIAVSVQPAPYGEVSPYLVEDFPEGADIEVRGPLGGWFVWRPDRTEPVLLVAGGSGVAPLVAMLRARLALPEGPAFHLVYSLRGPQERWFGDTLDSLAGRTEIAVDYAYTREAPPGSARPVGRIQQAELLVDGFTPAQAPLCFVCGPTAFVEHCANALVALGHRPDRVRTERFG
ncbi:FAD-binding oxidoreductase [Streptacidiphilus anmyonensis]|uniref:FAD-binding oxidoreductase n=1 Tax=Streptacidiphilus anmyonensis TaxID=405782 RepID=UPI0005A7252D|nr:FAD-binding oxidoreductase [Streptacidiphilus anmyonensis]